MASRADIRKRIHTRIRKKLAGTTERPRLAIFRSVAHIYAQVIDDTKGVTLASASSTEKGWDGTGGNVQCAASVCACNAGYTNCNPGDPLTLECRDLMTDPQNCGTCDNH